MRLRVLALFATTFVFTASPLVSRAEEETYLLRYGLQAGQKLTYRVVHSARTLVKMSDTEESSSVHTTSVRSWAITENTPEGDITFDHTIDSVVMTQQVGDQDEIRWDSQSDEIPPVQFNAVAEKLGQVIDTIQVNARGQVLERTGKSQTNLGMGDITIPLPDDAVKIGASWSVPRTVRVKDDNGNLKVIKVRELYKLVKVQAAVATISVNSEPITPIEDQGIRSQLVQQLSKGEIKFEMDKGYVISRELQWQADVVGFQGPRSNMEYNARLAETLVTEEPRAAGLQGPAIR